MSLRITVLGCALLASGCMHPVPTELLDARQAVDRASAGPAAQLVPADVHKSQEALALAEQAYKEDPRGYHTRDLAYVAERKAELAEALATSASDQKATAQANADLISGQSAIVADQRSQLDIAKATNAQTTAELTAAQQAARDADARTYAAVAALAAVKQETRGMVITLSGSVLFASDQAILLPEAQTRVSQVADALIAGGARPIVIEGHTDATGSADHNLDLSQRRAEAVRQALVSRGYAPALITARGIGSARPVADNGTAEGRANNRRVEIVVDQTAAAAYQ